MTVSEKAHAALLNNLRESWDALRLIREAVETLGPVGALPSSEHVACAIAPTHMAEAEAIVAGIQKIAALAQEPRPEQVEGEAVAWRVRERPGFPWELWSGDPVRHPKNSGFEIQPLYTTPPAPAAPAPDLNWRDDPTADERWNAGCDFAMTRLCAFLGVDPNSVSWDAATETIDGDVSAVIGNIMRAKFGEDWSPAAPAAPAATAECVEAAAMRTALERIERWFGEFPDTGRAWDDGSPMSYGACFGSNGERDFMRSIARAALATAPSAKPAEREDDDGA